MWCSARISALSRKYQRELSEDATPLVLELLDALERQTVNDLYVVTSLGQLKLTLAKSYREQPHHDEVWITPRHDVIVLSHVPAGGKEAVSEVECANVETALHEISEMLPVTFN
jgi:hypothetical protein